MVYKERPQNFIPNMEVCGCLIESENKILLLHRQDNKPQGGKWGLPAGKINKNENERYAIRREIYEETGLIVKEQDFIKSRTYYVCYPDISFLYHYYLLKIPKISEISLSNSEHDSYKWVTKDEALKMPLVEDEDYCMKDYYGIK